MSTPVQILLLYHFPSAPFSKNSVCQEPVPSAQSQFPALGLMCSFISSYHRAPARVPGTVLGTGDTEGRKVISVTGIWKSVKIDRVFHNGISISLCMVFLIVGVVKWNFKTQRASPMPVLLNAPMVVAVNMHFLFLCYRYRVRTSQTPPFVWGVTKTILRLGFFEVLTSHSVSLWVTPYHVTALLQSVTATQTFSPCPDALS